MIVTIVNHYIRQDTLLLYIFKTLLKSKVVSHQIIERANNYFRLLSDEFQMNRCVSTHLHLQKIISTTTVPFMLKFSKIINGCYSYAELHKQETPGLYITNAK